MRFVSTRASTHARGVSLATALLDGLAPDGGLYMPERIERWSREQLDQAGRSSLHEIAVRVLHPFTSDDLDEATLASVLRDALTFPVPLVEVEPGTCALELHHGPTLAFKDFGARVMARMMAALHDGGAPMTVLVATSGDTGSAVAHAFHAVPHTRVVILYPEGRVSPTQEAQLTRFNDGPSTVRAFAIPGTFDDCQRLVKAAFGDLKLRQRVRLTTANSINIGRLLSQMVYFWIARGAALVSVPSGNFGNLTAGLMARHAGALIDRFVAATNVNDVVPIYLSTGRFEPRPPISTLANAMDVGHPSNFERMKWLYGDNAEAMRRDVLGSRHTDVEIRTTIRRVYEGHGYLLDPHSAIAYLGIKSARRPTNIFLATAHPAKFAEIVEPIIGRAVEMPARLAEALARPPRVMKMPATSDALREILVG